MAIKAKGKNGVNDKLPEHTKGKGAKASQKTSPDQSAKAAKMGSSNERFGESDVKAGFKKLPEISSANDVNKGQYMYKPGETQNDSKTITDFESKKK